MFENRILDLILRDLQVCAGIVVVAMFIASSVALPMACEGFQSSYLRPFSRRLLLIWTVGVVNMAVPWIALTAILHQLLILSPERIESAWIEAAGSMFMLLFPAAYTLCFVVSLRKMWRLTQTPPADRPSQTFSLRTLLIAQFVIIFLCGLWVISRRREVEQIEHLRRVIQEDAPH